MASVHPRDRRGPASWLLVGLAVLYLACFLLVPLATVVAQSLEQGVRAYAAALAEPDTVSALRLSLLVAALVVPLNTCFGIAAAWCIAKYTFRGKTLLVSLIDLPLAVSPVVAGLVFVLLFGAHGFFGPWLADRGFKIIFAVPGIVLATMFVTLPFVARELVPLMQEQGRESEEVAISLGASGWQTFWRVTLPQARWGLVYGVILLNARTLGEFGAVSVVSGHIRGLTNTMPLQVEALYNEYQSVAAFSAASVLTLVALVTLVVKALVEWHTGRAATGSDRRAQRAAIAGEGA